MCSNLVHFVVHQNLDHLLQPVGREDFHLVYEDCGGPAVSHNLESHGCLVHLPEDCLSVQPEQPQGSGVESNCAQEGP